jgi:LysM repeat protein
MENSMSRLTLTRLWLILLIVAVALPFIPNPALAQGGTVVRAEASPALAQINNNITLSINVENVANLAAFEVHLQFNPAVLEVLQVTNGSFVAADFVAQNVFDNTAGTLDYAIAQLNRTPVQGSGTLVTIVFRAKANGSAVIGLRSTSAAPTGLLLADQNGGAIQANWINATVHVGPTPTPTALPPTATSTPVAPSPATATPTSVAPVPATATATPPPVVTPPAGTVPYGGTLGTHTVRLWETLYCLGRAYKVSPWAIAEANKIWWPYWIFPNQVLTIPNVPWTNIPAGPVCPTQFTPPPASTAPPPAPPTPTKVAVGPTATPAAGCRASYTVVAGDTLYSIATRYSTTYTKVAQVNAIADPSRIYPGQKLCIP